MVIIFNSEATSQFKKSVKRLKKRGISIGKLSDIIKCIKNGTLDPKHKDHALKGKFLGLRECHIEPDWLLVYRFEENLLFLIDTGTHQDIFG